MKKRKLEQSTNLLELTPKQAQAFEYRQDGQINILVPRFKNQFFQRLMPKNRSPYIKANLDELGSATWELINGNRSVMEIANILHEKYAETIEPAHERVGLFLQQMHRNNFITFIEFLEK